MTKNCFSSHVAPTLRLLALAGVTTLLASCALPQGHQLGYSGSEKDEARTVISTSGRQFTPHGPQQPREAVQGAGIDTHPRVEAARWYAESLRGEARAIGAERYPRLNLQAATGYAYLSGRRSGSRDYSRTGSSSAGSGGSMGSDWRARHEARLVLSQRLFDGGRVRYAEDAGMSRALAAELSANTTAQAIAVEYSTAHLDYLQARDIANLARHLVGTHERMLAMTTDKLRGGLQSQADVDLVRSRLKRSRSLLTSQELLKNDAEVRFRSIAGREPSAVSAPPRPRSSDLTALKMNKNWEVKAAEETLRSRQLEHESTRRLAYPSIDLEVGARAGDGFYGVATADEEVQALLVLNWDLLDGGYRKAERYRTEASINEARELIKATKLDVRQLWDLGSQLRIKSRERAAELSGYIANLTRAVDAIEADFASTKQPVLDMLDMQDELFEAKAEWTFENSNQLRGEYAMLAASGELVDILEGSGVPTRTSSSRGRLATNRSANTIHRPTSRSTHVPATTSYHRASASGTTSYHRPANTSTNTGTSYHRPASTRSTAASYHR